MTKRQVVVLTDGDETAYRALSEACHDLSCHPLVASQGNPTPLSGPELLQAIHQAPRDPVVVMVDDRGDSGLGQGEKALQALLDASDIEVLGVIAVAANTRPVQGVTVDQSVNQDGRLIDRAVDKGGHAGPSRTLKGDTVDVLNQFSGLVLGLGDPGKMDGHDAIQQGVPATRRALEEILRQGHRRDGPN